MGYRDLRILCFSLHICKHAKMSKEGNKRDSRTVMLSTERNYWSQKLLGIGVGVEGFIRSGKIPEFREGKAGLFWHQVTHQREAEMYPLLSSKRGEGLCSETNIPTQLNSSSSSHNILQIGVYVRRCDWRSPAIFCLLPNINWSEAKKKQLYNRIKFL